MLKLLRGCLHRYIFLIGRGGKLKFSLNLAEILNEMCNEEGVPLTEYVDWREVSDMLIRGELDCFFVSASTGDFFVLDIPVEDDEDEKM